MIEITVSAVEPIRAAEQEHLLEDGDTLGLSGGGRAPQTLGAVARIYAADMLAMRFGKIVDGTIKFTKIDPRHSNARSTVVETSESQPV